VKKEKYGQKSPDTRRRFNHGVKVHAPMYKTKWASFDRKEMTPN